MIAVALGVLGFIILLLAYCMAVIAKRADREAEDAARAMAEARDALERATGYRRPPQ